MLSSCRHVSRPQPAVQQGFKQLLQEQSILTYAFYCSLGFEFRYTACYRVSEPPITMAISRFHAAIDDGQTHEVGMNQAQLVIFGKSNIKAIGTQHLNGCTAVAVVSPFAAILAHILPQPYPTTDSSVATRNLQARMTEVLTLYQQNRAYFPQDSTSLVVGARFGGVTALPDQLDMINHLLRENGLTVFQKEYNVTEGRHKTAAQGTVFIDARSGTPVVYVEDQHIPM